MTTITEKMDRSRVYGYLRADGERMVNARGEEVLLTGMGLGNWLVPEGYMWRLGGRYNSPRQIEELVRDLCGSAYAAYFWCKFRENYITENDIRAMAEAGFNSVRVPINWRVLMEDEPGILWKEDGFRLLDRLLDWCEVWKLYVILDIHCAPGGQTGSNIDDSIDNIPRLFTDTRSDSWEKALSLWEQIAKRYRDRWIVGMYDLLNEPCRSPMPNAPELPNLDHRLKAFYKEVIARIRQVDKLHMLSLEGPQWATRVDIFDEHYDDNMCLHFHRYWLPPTPDAYTPYLEKQKEWHYPLYLGETGENHMEWFSAMYPMSAELNIGYNIWPWKKMDTDSSPCSVKKPDGWDDIIAYSHGGDRPSYAEAQAAFDGYLQNMRYENCDHVANVIPSIFRRPGCSIRACAWKQMENVAMVDEAGVAVTTDWEKAQAQFTADSWAAYTFYAVGDPGVLVFEADFDGAMLAVSENGETLLRTSASGVRTFRIEKKRTGDSLVRIECMKGSFHLRRIHYMPSQNDSDK